MRKLILALVLACPFISDLAAGDIPRVPGDQMTVEQIRRGAPAVHPATLFLLAERLFESGDKDEAVFWYYAARLRFEFYLRANPQLEPEGDPALFLTLSQRIGASIRHYAFVDRPMLAKTLDRVALWDAENPNGFTSKENNHAVWLEVRGRFAALGEGVRSGKLGEAEG